MCDREPNSQEPVVTDDAKVKEGFEVATWWKE